MWKVQNVENQNSKIYSQIVVGMICKEVAITKLYWIGSHGDEIVSNGGTKKCLIFKS